jgi:hypothetical protein
MTVFFVVYIVLNGVGELHNTLLFSNLTHPIQVFLQSSLPQFSPFLVYYRKLTYMTI